MKSLKNIILGILAHVDAGKTTLSEAILYTSGVVRQPGRVDKGNAYLDTFDLEKKRGITIFSKQAKFVWNDTDFSVLDTPGHVDFSAEMERTLQVLDYAALVISGSGGIQSHVKTLWELLKIYKVPVFIFVNKMDQPLSDKEKILYDIKKQLGEDCIDFSKDLEEDFFEEVSSANEEMMEKYLEDGEVSENMIAEAIAKRQIFPCFFGSALKIEGVRELMDGICKYTVNKSYPEEFGARIYKISRDKDGNRLTHLKVTGGCIRVKEVIDDSDEKINQIRIYSGDKFSTVNEIKAGEVCAVTGLTKTYSGQTLGAEKDKKDYILEPVLSYRVVLPENMDAMQMFPKLKEISEEEPELSVKWDEEAKEIKICIMGEVQIQIVKSIVKDRFGVDIDFDSGNVVYKETIESISYGAGHFEPLRHYAEVHLKLEPLEAGSGLVFESDCSENVLAKNWQRLILTHLGEKRHRGVLTGSTITDMKITVIGGKAHLKHTEGGDFRQATYRAVRHGLKMADSILLEPYYNFRLEVPTNMVGRAMTDIEKMFGKMNPPENEGEISIITGYAPVVTIREYQQDVMAYTKGQVKIFCTFKGYYPCHNPEEIIESMGYDSELDAANPTGSVFCTHGAGFYVTYDMVNQYMHTKPFIESGNFQEDYINNEVAITSVSDKSTKEEEIWVGTEEIDEILNRTYNANKKSKGEASRNNWKRSRSEEEYFNYKGSKSNLAKNKKEEYLLVDGYNVIFAWEDLKELAEVNLDGARGRLLDILCNYQAVKGCNLIVVFDAYRVKNHLTEVLDYYNIHIVYTKEAETADQYIEKFAHENGVRYNVTVATSDGLEQIIIRGEGCRLISSREFREEINRAVQNEIQRFEEKKQDW